MLQIFFRNSDLANACFEGLVGKIATVEFSNAYALRGYNLQSSSERGTHGKVTKGEGHMTAESKVNIKSQHIN